MAVSALGDFTDQEKGQMLLEGAWGWKHLGGSEPAIIWGKKMSNKEKGSPVSWFAGWPQWVGFLAGEGSCLRIVICCYGPASAGELCQPHLPVFLPSSFPFLRDAGLWGAFWDSTFSAGKLLHPTGLAGSVSPFEEGPMSHDNALGGISSRSGWRWEIINIFKCSAFIFDLGLKMFGVELISVVFLCLFHAEETG